MSLQCPHLEGAQRDLLALHHLFVAPRKAASGEKDLESVLIWILQ
jgi:hypothetical protein